MHLCLLVVPLRLLSGQEVIHTSNAAHKHGFGTAGEVVQAIDMNQDMHFEEALKLRPMMEEFQFSQRNSFVRSRKCVFSCVLKGSGGRCRDRLSAVHVGGLSGDHLFFQRQCCGSLHGTSGALPFMTFAQCNDCRQ